MKQDNNDPEQNPKINWEWFDTGRLCDWEFLPNHFLVIDLKHWVFGIGIYINANSIEIDCLCFNVTIQ